MALAVAGSEGGGVGGDGAFPRPRAGHDSHQAWTLTQGHSLPTCLSLKPGTKPWALTYTLFSLRGDKK